MTFLSLYNKVDKRYRPINIVPRHFWCTQDFILGYKGATTGGGGGEGPDPPKFGGTTPTFLMKSVITVTYNRLQSTKLGIPSVFCSVQS